MANGPYLDRASGGAGPADHPLDGIPHSVRIVKSVEEWSALEPKWKALFALSPAASPALRWEWLRDWWAIYGSVCVATGLRAGDDGLRIAVVHQGDDLVAVLPLYLNRGMPPLRRRRLMFLASGEAESEEICSEYLGLLPMPNAGELSANLLRTALLDAPNGDWDVLDLGPISAESPLCSTWTGGGAPCLLSHRGQAHVMELVGGYEAYLGRLSANGRGLARKRVRQAVAAGATLDVAATAEDVDAMFAELAELHAARWRTVGRTGCFVSERFRQFHLAQARQGVPTGAAVLARLRGHGETLAATLGYLERGKLDIYVSGTRIGDGLPIKSPGVVLQLLLAERMAEVGCTACDHLGGDSTYKSDFTTSRVERVGLVLERPTLKTRLSRTMDIGKQIVRRGRSALSLIPRKEETPCPIPPST